MQLELKRSLRKAAYDAQGMISVGIKAMNADQARKTILQHAQQDIERGQLANSGLPAQEGLENLGVAASGSEELLQSLGTVLDKIQVIADAPVDVVDVVAKVGTSVDFWNQI